MDVRCPGTRPRARDTEHPGARSEYNLEVFYRFPVLPLVDMTLSYQSIFNPALDLDNDHASVFSMRIRTTF